MWDELSNRQAGGGNPYGFTGGGGGRAVTPWYNNTTGQQWNAPSTGFIAPSNDWTQGSSALGSLPTGGANPNSQMWANATDQQIRNQLTFGNIEGTGMANFGMYGPEEIAAFRQMNGSNPMVSTQQNQWNPNIFGGMPPRGQGFGGQYPQPQLGGTYNPQAGITPRPGNIFQEPEVAQQQQSRGPSKFDLAHQKRHKDYMAEISNYQSEVPGATAWDYDRARGLLSDKGLGKWLGDDTANSIQDFGNKHLGDLGKSVANFIPGVSLFSEEVKEKPQNRVSTLSPQRNAAEIAAGKIKPDNRYNVRNKPSKVYPKAGSRAANRGGK